MLILTRRTNETFIIGGNIIVKVHSIIDRQVNLQIDAPEHIKIHSSQIYHRARKHNKKSKRLTLADSFP